MDIYETFGWLKDISTKDLINRKFFHTCDGDLAMVKVCEAELNKRLTARLA